MIPLHLVVAMTLDGQRYALALAQVERVIRAVEIVPLPKAPVIVAGVIDVHGQVIPVLNIRQRFRLPERELALSDRILIARTARRTVALIVDQADTVLELSDRQIVTPEQILPNMEYIAGVATLDDGMVLIHDLDRFLSLGEEDNLDLALAAGAVQDP